MITIKNVKTVDGQTTTLKISSHKDQVLEADGLLLLPGLIDTHISCGSPKQGNWLFAIESAVRGGVTTIVDIPSQDLACETKKELELKKELVEKRLLDLRIPLRYAMYGKGNSKHLDDIGLEKKLILGSILLLTPEDAALEDRVWERIFQLAAWEDFPIVINSRNENAWGELALKPAKDTVLGKALRFAEKQNTRLYVLNVATQQEIDLIGDARRRSLLVYAETTLQHLFPRDGTKVKFLWDALNQGIIETIGSGYRADVMNNDRMSIQGVEFDFSNPQFLLPMLLTAHLEGKITLENIVRSTRINVYDVIKIERKDQDVVLVDLEKEQVLQRHFDGSVREKRLKGWPVYTIIKGEIFSCTGDKSPLERI